ncbi:NAD(P)-dependent oxidoreductase [Amycolatopsis sp. FDAARGOS 1241]|uniref:NAD-dependent epimerase/dehydratase family protein n=1 Tax=Amycolatopsis sp. FDAARGOS 1241 TaxID=2778070 RepID=UPI001950EEA2|nr:NAD(P)-dependent oxidoreductase [Amycolatopsis sp. FDAARGOS 1241]QRP44834.1 NAD(P)-dependent oxidoreductase [Amycolatopsis sp. FDAARGOS 1241]
MAVGFDGHDAVVNLASALPPMSRFLFRSAWRRCEHVRTEGSATVAEACRRAGVGQLVQESVCLLYRAGGPDWVDEDTPVDRFPAARGNLAAEANATGGVVLRFGWFYGPGARHSEQLLTLARRHLVLELGPPTGYLSTIHVADAGAAVVAALTARPGTYNIVDDEPLTERAFSDALSSAAGARPWLRGPSSAALLFGDRLTSLTRSLRVRNTRFVPRPGGRPSTRAHARGWRRWLDNRRFSPAEEPALGLLTPACPALST